MSITAMFAYNQYSEGGKELADAIGIKRVKHSGSKFKPTSSQTVLNWGATSDRYPAQLLGCRILNPPSSVDNACDKVRSFNAFKAQGVSTPEFTTSLAQARQWLEAGQMVFARTQLRAHSGRGIVIMDPEFPENWETSAPLYVKYVPKKHEYRIHVMNGVVIDIQRKGLKAELQGTEGINYKIRNLANGFIYVRNDDAGVPLINSSTVPNVVKEVGRAAVQALNLDFGAADVIFNDKAKRAYALEVNTAPGLSGTTITNYANALRQY